MRLVSADYWQHEGGGSCIAVCSCASGLQGLRESGLGKTYERRVKDMIMPLIV